jgi:hypothetical protein
MIAKCALCGLEGKVSGFLPEVGAFCGGEKLSKNFNPRGTPLFKNILFIWVF